MLTFQNYHNPGKENSSGKYTHTNKKTQKKMLTFQNYHKIFNMSHLKQHRALNISCPKHSICLIQNNTKHLICLIQNTHCVLSKTTQDAQCLIQNNTNTQNFSSKVGVVYLMYHRVIKLLMCSC
jgi:uncharacterized membrane protein